MLKKPKGTCSYKSSSMCPKVLYNTLLVSNFDTPASILFSSYPFKPLFFGIPYSGYYYQGENKCR